MNYSVLLTLALAVHPQIESPALPAPENFKSAVWQIVDALTLTAQNLRSKSTPVDSGELLQFTYTETETHSKLDSKGRPSSSQTDVYHVIRGPEAWQFYRKRISTDGVPASAADLEKQDAEQREVEEKQRRQIASQAEKTRKEAAKRQNEGKPQKARTPDEERKFKDDALFRWYSSIYNVRVVRKETVDGYRTVLISLEPKAGVKPDDDFLKVLHHVSLRGWITEEGHNLLRMEADVIDTISLGLGILARFQEGSRMILDRRPIHDVTWAPVRVEGTVSARILLLKGRHERQVSQYSDFRKFAVETSLKMITFEPPPEP